MQKKILIALALALTILAVYLVVSDRKGTYTEKRDFAVEDTALVDKIFLADKANNSVLLERTDGNWTLNQKYTARPDLTNLLLKTIHLLKVKSPVAKSAQDNIIKSLAVKSTKVEVYQNGKLVRTFYVGGPTPDSHGTYMILDKSTTPFIMDLPGFRGYLSTRFITTESDWRWQLVFNLKPEQIAGVTMVNHLQPANSFQLSSKSAKVLALNDLQTKIITDTVMVNRYLNSFKGVFFNKFIDDVPLEWQDSIKQTQPMYELTVTQTNGKVQQIKAFNKPGWGRVDEFGEVLKNDPDNFFLLLETGELVYAQYLSFFPLFKSLRDFELKK